MIRKLKIIHLLIFQTIILIIRNLKVVFKISIAFLASCGGEGKCVAGIVRLTGRKKASVHRPAENFRRAITRVLLKIVKN